MHVGQDQEIVSTDIARALEHSRISRGGGSVIDLEDPRLNECSMRLENPLSGACTDYASMT